MVMSSDDLAELAEVGQRSTCRPTSLVHTMTSLSSAVDGVSTSRPSGRTSPSSAICSSTFVAVGSAFGIVLAQRRTTAASWCTRGRGRSPRSRWPRSRPRGRRWRAGSRRRSRRRPAPGRRSGRSAGSRGSRPSRRRPGRRHRRWSASRRRAVVGVPAAVVRPLPSWPMLSSSSPPQAAAERTRSGARTSGMVRRDVHGAGPPWGSAVRLVSGTPSGVGHLYDDRQRYVARLEARRGTVAARRSRRGVRARTPGDTSDALEQGEQRLDGEHER